MLLANHDLLIANPLGFVLLLTVVGMALLLSISVHEFSHAAAAYLQGDKTAKRQGRLTLNPKAHLDPTGTLMIAIVGFGWGRPVPVMPSALRNGRQGMAFVSLAGPASNVILALAIAALFRLGIFDEGRLVADPFSDPSLLTWWVLLGWFGVTLNLILAVFNLLPLAPLDGSGILRGIVPHHWLDAVDRIERVGPIILLVVVLIGLFTQWSLLRVIFDLALDLANALVGA